MRTLGLASLLVILPFTIGKFVIVIKQFVNNAEVLVNTTQLTTTFGASLKFKCYLTLQNTSYVNQDVRWKIPSFSENFIINGSTVSVEGTDWTNEGSYMCMDKKFHLSKSFYLKVDLSDSFIFKDIYKPEISNEFLKPHEPIFYRPNFTDNFYYNLPSYTDKGPIFFVPAVIVIILGIIRMCYFLKSRRTVTWERLSTPNCNHNLCNHRRRTDPLATCLLPHRNSERLSIVIVGQVNETAENLAGENDVPPSYNEVIPQDLPPTYTEAVATTNSTSSTTTT